MATYTVQVLITVDDYEEACKLMNDVCDKVNDIVDESMDPYSAYVLDEEGHPVY